MLQTCIHRVLWFFIAVGFVFFLNGPSLSWASAFRAPLKNASLPATPEESRLLSFKHDLWKIANQTAAFWLSRGIDHVYGGFFGTIKQDGSVVKDAPKQLSQQARHLWFLSAYSRFTGNLKVKEEAKKIFTFIHQKFKTASGSYVLYTDHKGEQQPSHEKKLWLYSHSFVIFAFSEYFKVSGDPVALEEALSLFKSFPHDAHYGGYDQSGESRWYEGTKETNSHMHAMEASANLLEALPPSMDSERFMLENRLRELYDIFTTRVISQGFAYHDAFDAQWRTAGHGYVNFGHDYEIVHILLKVRKILKIKDQESFEAIQKLGQKSIQNGYDQEWGGAFYKGAIDGKVENRAKIWWVQCELLLSLYRLYQESPTSDILHKMEQTLTWIRQHHLSTEIAGAWFATADNQGSSEWSQDLGSEWFASYHTMRALLTILEHDWHRFKPSH